jgi:hypothetical protein
MLDLEEIFEKYNDEFLEFDRVENKLSERMDLHAFILLDKLVPGTSDIVCSSEHDEFWVDTNPEELASVATEQNIIDLIRCGMQFEEGLGFSFLT